MIEYHDKYNEEREKIAKRQPLWCKTKDGKSVHVDFLSEKLYVKFRKSLVEMGGQLHHDFSALTAVQKHSLKVNCKYGHTIETCKCELPVYHMGQDESIYKSHAHPKKGWKVNGTQKVYKKGDGTGVMISAVVDKHRGFGFPLTDEELLKINEYRRAQDRTIFKKDSLRCPTGSPGLKFLNHGENR